MFEATKEVIKNNYQLPFLKQLQKDIKKKGLFSSVHKGDKVF